MKNNPRTIDEYIATFPENVQTVLEQVRQAIKEAAPEAEETISYQMPAFKQNGILVWFAAFRTHLSLFPKVSAIEAFKDQLSAYQTSKGTIQFPLNQPIPFNLIKEIVKYRVKENLSKK
jgi:uncharacterized protein YdhG (YjbR/CyaY superfamily)